MLNYNYLLCKVIDFKFLHRADKKIKYKVKCFLLGAAQLTDATSRFDIENHSFIHVPPSFQAPSSGPPPAGRSYVSTVRQVTRHKPRDPLQKCTSKGRDSFRELLREVTSCFSTAITSAHVDFTTGGANTETPATRLAS